MSGKIVSRRVAAGDAIRQGDIVARLDAQDFENKVRTAETDVMAATAVLAEAVVQEHFFEPAASVGIPLLSHPEVSAKGFVREVAPIADPAARTFQVKAAAYACSSTAFPMLIGTLVTIAGFVPIGFTEGGAGAYCFTLFVVVAVALVVSWAVAVLFTPLTGVSILPDKMRGHGHGKASLGSRVFRAVLGWSMRRSTLTLGATAVPFALPNALLNLSKLSVWWLRLGITIERIKPGRPQQNGRHDVSFLRHG